MPPFMVPPVQTESEHVAYLVCLVRAASAKHLPHLCCIMQIPRHSWVLAVGRFLALHAGKLNPLLLK